MIDAVFIILIIVLLFNAGLIVYCLEVVYQMRKEILKLNNPIIKLIYKDLDAVNIEADLLKIYYDLKHGE